jgi:O-antigen/teichoic acid export membrane protein
VLGGVLLLVDGRALLRIWVGQSLTSAFPILAVLAAGYTINLALHPMLLILIARGKHGPLGAWTIAEGVANIGLSIVWGKSHGLMGVALGTAVPMLVMKLFIQPYYALRSVQVDAWTYLRGGLARPLIVGALFLVAAKMIETPSVASLPALIAVVFAQMSGFAVITWFFGLTTSEQGWLRAYRKHHVRRFIPVKRPALVPGTSEADTR